MYDSAVAVELTHLASLYHDDVMDEAPMRRGVESAQLAFGNTVAILAGDILFSRASTIVAGLGPRSVDYATMFERLCTGQLHETIGLAAGENPREHYISVLADKTGSLSRHRRDMAFSPQAAAKSWLSGCPVRRVRWRCIPTRGRCH